MIKVKDLTPDIYHNQSRDFQFISRLYDLVLNSVKTGTDMINTLPLNTNLDNKLVDLVATTLGFKQKHNYNIKQLVAICNIFPTILRKKGSIQAIQLIGDALLNAEGLTDECTVSLSDDKCEVTVTLSKSLSDTTLFYDLLNYVLPAGMSCHLITVLTKNEAINTTAATNISVKNDYNRASKKSVVWRVDTDPIPAGHMTNTTIVDRISD